MRTNRYRMTALLVALVAIGTGCLAVGTTTDTAALTAAVDVNNGGVIVGYGPTQAALLDTTTGVATPIGTLGGTGRTYPKAINDDGVVVGLAPLPSGTLQAFVLRPGSPMVPLGALSPATNPGSDATDVDSAGVIVGSSRIRIGGVDAFHAVVYEPGTGIPHDLGTLGGTNSEATAISDAGLIVGWSEVTVGSGVQHPFVFDLWTGTMHDIGTLGGTYASATDVNEHGTVVGWAETTNCDYGCKRQAFTYDAATGSFDTLAEGIDHDHWSFAATAINEDGVIVGTSTDPISCSACPKINSAVAWEQGTTGLYSLTQPPGYTAAAAVNDSGLAVGSRLVPTGRFEPAIHTAFWVPVTRIAS